MLVRNLLFLVRWQIKAQMFEKFTFYFQIIEGIMGCEESFLAKAREAAYDVPNLGNKGQMKRKNGLERINGRQTDQQVFQNIKRVDYCKTINDIQFIQKAISKHFLLFKLSKQERKELANAMECYEADKDDYIFRQGTPASMFFIIRQGEVAIEINNSVVTTMKKGDFFGELALIYSAPRSASVKVTQKCSFWCLSRHLFLKIQREMVKHNYKIAKLFVNKLPLFSFLSSKQKDSISYNMNTLKYSENQAIFKAGDDAISFFVIISGLVQINIPSKAPIQFRSGDSFGQNCLKQNQIRSGTAICIEKTQLLAISREDLKHCLGDKSLEQFLYYNILKWSLRRSQLFKNINNFDEAKIIKSGQFYLKNDQQVIIDVGQTQDKVYICLQGKINDFQVGAIVNQEEAIDQNIESFVAQKRLLKHQYGYIFGIPLSVIQKQRRAKIKAGVNVKKIDIKNDLTIARSQNLNTNVQLKDLYVLSRLGEGQMGKVYLVQNKQNQKRYALKCIQKNIVLKNHMQKFLINEKQTLQAVESPFIVKLHNSYKDSHFVYLLLDYIQGGDFFDFLSDIGICNSATAQFYFGCLLLGIQYMHQNQIVYRDLKPQNAAIDSKGYLHIIDMGTAKFLQDDDDKSGFRTFTIIGTPHYMAPEVLQAKGYSFEVDLWSLGIILYEMVCGALPYGSFSQDPVNIYKEIQQTDLKFPRNYSDKAGKHLISRLLQKKPQKRAIEDFSELKNMEYFKNFNWSLLQEQKMTAPIKPKISDQKAKHKSQYLLSYMQKQKMKMQKPIDPQVKNWDQMF